MDRGLYKSKAKEAFKRNYWTCVIVSLALFIFCTSHNSGSSSARSRNNSSSGNGNNIYWQLQQNPSNPSNPANLNYNQLQQYVQVNKSGDDATTASGSSLVSKASALKVQGLTLFYKLFTRYGSSAIMGILMLIVGVMLLVAFALRALVFAPLQVGGRKFYIENARDEYTPGLSELAFGFRGGHYGKVVAGMFLKDLIITLVYAPFIIGILLIALASYLNPTLLAVGIILTLIGVATGIFGIYLSYSWRVVDYVLADDPDTSPMAALRRSNEIMNGYRFESFILDLSFIFWNILAGITIHIAGIFWVYPYKDATYAEMYLDLSGYSPKPKIRAPRPDYRINNEDGFNWGDDDF